MLDKKIDIFSLLPKKSYVGEDIIIKEQGKNILVYYITKYPTGQSKAEKFQPAKALFSKYFLISSEDIECFGMYQGDGQKSIKSKSYQSTRFANSDPKLLQKFIEFLQRLGIKEKNLKYNLSVSRNINLNEEELKEFWSKTLNINKSGFYKIQLRDNKYSNSKVEPKGTLTIIYSNSSFRVVFDALFNYVKRESLKQKRGAAYFLRGLIAADGNVYHKGSKKEVNIAAKPQEDRLSIQKLFSLLGIKPNKDNTTPGKETVRVTGYPNFEIIQKYNLCDLHPKKEDKFKKAMGSYKNKCRRKGDSILLILKKLEKPKTTNQLAREMQRGYTSIKRYLYILENKSLIKRIKSLEHEVPQGRIPERWIKSS